MGYAAQVMEQTNQFVDKVATMVGKAISEVFVMAKGDRKLEYSEGAVGITSLIYCPHKVDLKAKYPEIEPDDIEIADGFDHERAVYDALVKMFGPFIAKKEMILPYTSPQGLLIEGHADISVFGKDTLVILECKHTKMAYHSLPFGSVPRKTQLIWQPELVEKIHFSEAYILQSRIQKYIAQQAIPHKSVEHFILEKTMIKLIPYGLKKMYILRRTTEECTQEGLEGLITRYLNDKKPRYGWECEYCGYKDAGVCKGIDVPEKPHFVELADLPQTLHDAVEAYRRRWEELKDMEDYLKKELNGRSVKVGNGKGKLIGWVPKTKSEWNCEKLCKDFGTRVGDKMQVNWRNQDELERFLYSLGVELSDYRTVTTKKEWKGL